MVSIGGDPEVLLELAPLHLLQVLPPARHQGQELLLVKEARFVLVSCSYHQPELFPRQTLSHL